VSRAGAQLIKGLYAIADTSVIAEDGLVDEVTSVLRGGCRIIQYRDKSFDRDKRSRQATQLAQTCREFGAIFIINDDVELAIAVEADGVHVGRDDTAVAAIKQNFPGLIIGASCYNSLELAGQAANAGADYLAFGSFFPSTTKPEAPPADIETLLKAKQRFKLPVVAIGGIMEDNAPGLVSSGADAIAVISGVFSTPDSYVSSRKFTELFEI
jgi:thiamine-phosphate pyrophosphorylase